MTTGRKAHPKPASLPAAFYTRNADTVAPDLLGMYICRRMKAATLVGRIVEVEAYMPDDPASHAYRGMTRRNEVMFAKGGVLYVYFTYGMHFCANVVTGPEGSGQAVLIRGVEPMVGISAMRAHRKMSHMSDLIGLTNGPAKFCKAFGIGRTENGTNLLGDEVYLLRGEKVHPADIRSSRRIGISRGKSRRWRFFLRGNPWVSR